MISKDKKIFFLVFIITFTIFVFTSHGHRYTSDEYLAYVQARQIATLSPSPDLIPEDYRLHLRLGGTVTGSPNICKNGILCSFVPIGHAISYVPFIVVGNQFHIIPEVVFAYSDFNDPVYVSWRNSTAHPETLTFLFFGPLFSALSTATVFQIGRTYDYNQKTSIIIAFLFGFSTIIWAYSTTGFNSVEAVLFILLGLLFYKKFQKSASSLNLILMSAALGFGITVRNDVAIFVVVLYCFLMLQLVRMNKKKANLVCSTLPLVFFVILMISVDFIRFGNLLGVSASAGTIRAEGHTTPLQLGIFGLLFSPGAGIFIFSPILLTAFLSFRDFYNRNKRDLILFAVFITIVLLFYGSWAYWHGFIGWSARYMLPAIFFFIFPLGASIEKHKSKLLNISIIALAELGAIFSLSWLVQDVSWFVWGQMGQDRGLYGLHGVGHPLQLNPVVFWTFEYSQLTHSLILQFTQLQLDLYLFKVLGGIIAFLIIAILVIPSTVYLLRLIRTTESLEKESK